MLRFTTILAAIGLLSTFLESEVHAQAVQLPTIQRTSVGTSVLVPDRGAAYLGGIRRSQEGSVTRGIGGVPLLTNRAYGRSDSVSSFSVHAQIIDLRELDEAVLAEGAARRTARETNGGGMSFADALRRPDQFVAGSEQPIRLDGPASRSAGSASSVRPFASASNEARSSGSDGAATSDVRQRADRLARFMGRTSSASGR